MENQFDTGRLEGCLLGLACGNALGLPFQDIWPAEKILEQSGGRVRFIDPSEKDTPWDDDTAQAMVVAHALAHGPLTLESLGKDLVGWRKANGRGIKTLVERVLDDIEGDVDVAEASEDACQRLGRNWSATNSALVRGIPVALKHRADPDILAEQSEIACKVTHWNPLCVHSSVAMNLAIATILRDEPLHLTALAEAMAVREAPESVCDAIRAARAPLPLFELDGKAKAFTLKALQVGLWALARAEAEIEDHLEAVVFAGGDTGTNAAVAGACMGALRGKAALPIRWIERLHDAEAISKAALALV